QIAHNVEIGAHTAIAACCGISGSSKIGAHCVLAGGVGLVGHIEICDNVHITGMTMITKSITQAGSYSSGTAFDSTDNWKKMAVRLRKLDDMAKRLRELEGIVQRLTQDQG
ncbi:MAG TPA: UDP-3-O-(3-hydroxymyristoyl)glucosamine N-acyltransferase, partial [Agitococcus sp.]|nr:UDP-3-O-(3-hydroxymyristoyl)glucosamine N-acyltransferase [Agitococcus sp.]